MRTFTTHSQGDGQEAQFLQQHSRPSILTLCTYRYSCSRPWSGRSVSPARQLLAVYPLLLLYATIGWLALVKG